jgi:hypothetical protein
LSELLPTPIISKRRKCRICKKRLSIYNYSDVCFCHPQHPAYHIPELSLTNKFTSPTNLGRFHAIKDYYGQDF